MDNIFRSCFLLKLCIKEIEDKYTQEKEEKIFKMNRILTYIFFTFNVGGVITVSFFFDYFALPVFQANLFGAYISFLIYLVFLLFILCKIKNPSVNRIINYGNYFLFFFSFTSIRYPLIHFLDLSPLIFYTILLLELILRLIFPILGIMGFIENFILNSILIIIMWSVYGTLGEEKTTIVENMLILLAYSACLITITILAYFLEKQQKSTFYHIYKSEKKSKWLLNILDNLNGGFLSIKDQKVRYVNKYLKDIIESDKQFKLFCERMQERENLRLNNPKIEILTNTKPLNEKNKNYPGTNVNKLLVYLLKDLQIDTISKSILE